MLRFSLRSLACLLGALSLASGASTLASGSEWHSIPTRIFVSEKFPALHGALHSRSRFCSSRRRLLVYRVHGHRPAPVGRGFSHRGGTWKVSLGKKLNPGHYYVIAAARRSARFRISCPRARSKRVPVVE